MAVISPTPPPQRSSFLLILILLGFCGLTFLTVRRARVLSQSDYDEQLHLMVHLPIGTVLSDRTTAVHSTLLRDYEREKAGGPTPAPRPNNSSVFAKSQSKSTKPVSSAAKGETTPAVPAARSGPCADVYLKPWNHEKGTAPPPKLFLVPRAREERTGTGPPRRIVDVIQWGFEYELPVLKVRLLEMLELVDELRVVEANVGFNNRPKNYSFPLVLDGLKRELGGENPVGVVKSSIHVPSSQLGGLLQGRGRPRLNNDNSRLRLAKSSGEEGDHHHVTRSAAGRKKVRTVATTLPNEHGPINYTQLSPLGYGGDLFRHLGPAKAKHLLEEIKLKVKFTRFQNPKGLHGYGMQLAAIAAGKNASSLLCSSPRVHCVFLEGDADEIVARPVLRALRECVVDRTSSTSGELEEQWDVVVAMRNFQFSMEWSQWDVFDWGLSTWVHSGLMGGEEDVPALVGGTVRGLQQQFGRNDVRLGGRGLHELDLAVGTRSSSRHDEPGRGRLSEVENRNNTTRSGLSVVPGGGGRGRTIVGGDEPADEDGPPASSRFLYIKKKPYALALANGLPGGWHLSWMLGAEGLANKVTRGRIEGAPPAAQAFVKKGKQATVDYYEEVLRRPNKHVSLAPSCVKVVELPETFRNFSGSFGTMDGGGMMGSTVFQAVRDWEGKGRTSTGGEKPICSIADWEAVQRWREAGG